MNKNILVVDDCNTTRKLIMCMVKSAGFSPLGAINGLNALEKLAQHEIDLVLTDLNMPQMDGLDLIRAIRSDAGHKEMPIIMLTTESEDRDRNVGIEAGADMFLTKPVASKRLAYEICKLL